MVTVAPERKLVPVIVRAVPPGRGAPDVTLMEKGSLSRELGSVAGTDRWPSPRDAGAAGDRGQGGDGEGAIAAGGVRRDLGRAKVSLALEEKLAGKLEAGRG